MAEPADPNLVSIILPTHNRATLIHDALQSVAKQTYRPLELLIVDDGSQDQTPTVIQSWLTSLVDDPELRVVIQQQPNRGAPAARNSGLRAARGEFIQFMDSDDALLPQKIAWQVDYLQNEPGIDFVWSDTQLVRHERFTSVVENLSWGYRNATCPPVTSRGLKQIPANAVSGLFRRELCRRLGPWSETLQRHQDWEYMLRILHDQPGVGNIPAKLYVVRLHDEGRISDLGKRHHRSIRARLEAAKAAERYAVQHALDKTLNATYRQRMKARYWKILVDSLVSLTLTEACEALSGIGRSYRFSQHQRIAQVNPPKQRSRSHSTKPVAGR